MMRWARTGSIALSRGKTYALKQSRHAT
jgi:hypothetical protein